MKQVLAVQLPAVCPLVCAFCRTPAHGEGDPEAVLEAVRAQLPGHHEIYLTSNGETGLSRVFGRVLEFARKQGVDVSTLCATEKSIVPGLRRAEISLNEYTQPLAQRAIDKAKHLAVPFTISLVDDGTAPIDLERVADEHGADGVIVRALQKEGRSTSSRGVTRTYAKAGKDLGCFPVEAYAELRGHGYHATCIDHFGETVQLLGSPA